MLISKIVSGGQTGVDRGALEAALELGFPYGGLIPKGRIAEDGIVPLKFAAMTDDTRRGYLHSMEMNVVNSDATLIILPYDDEHPDGQSALSGRAKRAWDFADKHVKPCLVIFNMNAADNIYSTLCWLKDVKETCGLKDGVVLNVVGPKDAERKGVQAIAYRFVSGLIREANSVDEDTLDWRWPDELD